MSNEATFLITKTALLALLSDIGKGKLQLPDFQRDWIWNDDHIISLLASITLSYPVGSVMLLTTGNPRVRFKPRPIDGVILYPVPVPDDLILDGQQRLTALFQSLDSRNVVKTRDSRGKEIYRWYYVDVHKLLDTAIDREDAIVGIPEDKKLRNFRGEVIADYSTQEKECEAELFPLSLVFDIAGQLSWQMTYLTMSSAAMANNLSRWSDLMQKVILPLQQYQVPVMQLSKETPKEAVCQIFEKVNTGGVPLNIFELLTAIYAADEFKLREDWDCRIKHLRQHRVLASLGNTDFLQAVTLLATYTNKKEGTATAIGCKRKDILEMELEDYKRFADLALKGFEEVVKFLFRQKIFSSRDLPYPTQMIPLAVIFAVMGKHDLMAGNLSKLEQWYWCGVFGELYGSATESQFARDVPEVVAWMNGGPIPSTVERATFSPGRLLTLRTRNSAAYKGINALLLKNHISDFRSEIPISDMSYFDDRIDIHHIFPQAWCNTHDIEARRYNYNSIINKTPLSAKTNQIIGGNAPSFYLTRLQNQAGISAETMDSILSAHAIEPDYLRTDNFAAFFQARQSALLNMIEKAMGKAIARDMVQEDSVVDTAQDRYEYQEDEEMEAV